MPRQRRLDVLFIAVIVASLVLVTVAYARKSGDCAARGGTLVLFGRYGIHCQRPDGSLIPI